VLATETFGLTPAGIEVAHAAICGDPPCVSTPVACASTDKLALRAIEDRRIKVIEIIALVFFAAKFILPFSY
jgi:hypothetical protein